MSVSILCTALLGALLFGLGFYVSIERFRRQKIIGHGAGATDPLHRAVRAHANTAEYVPYFAVLFLWYAMHQPPFWIVAIIVVATAARFVIAAGLLWFPLDKPNPARFAGAIMTYLCGLLLAAGLVLI